MSNENTPHLIIVIPGGRTVTIHDEKLGHPNALAVIANALDGMQKPRNDRGTRRPKPPETTTVLHSGPEANGATQPTLPSVG